MTDVVVSARIPRACAAQLDALADVYGGRRSDVIRRALDEWVGQHDHDDPEMVAVSRAALAALLDVKREHETLQAELRRLAGGAA